MPALKNARHEAFAFHRFKGKGIDEAYQLAGYSANPGNAGRLNNKEQVHARIAELQETAARAAIQAIAYDAKSLFARLEAQIAGALADGEHKVAGDLRMFMIRCFGYEDSPTLTHEHIAGRNIAPTAPQIDNSGVVEMVRVPRFASAILAFKRKLAE